MTLSFCWYAPVQGSPSLLSVARQKPINRPVRQERTDYVLATWSNVNSACVTMMGCLVFVGCVCLDLTVHVQINRPHNHPLAGPHRSHLTSSEASSRYQSYRLKMKNISGLYSSEKSVRLTCTSGHPPASGEQQGLSSRFRGLVAGKLSLLPFAVVWGGNVSPCLRRQTLQMHDGDYFVYDCFLNHTNDRFRPV